ncbi:MAG: hypothetical protein IIZ09_09965 [Ruminococcus sp.]|nr:hypothetical protein [Ruminococcus sp.]
MADKFSIDDLLAEFSKNKNTDTEDTADVDKEYSSTDTADDIKPVQAVIPDLPDIDTDDELDEAALQRSYDNSRSKLDSVLDGNASDAARRISELSDDSGRNKRPGAASDQPVKRTSVKDIRLGLTGKILPRTEELDNDIIPDDADYIKKSKALHEHRRKKIESFVLDPVEEDEPETAVRSSGRRKTVNGQKEFENFEDAPDILNDILHVKNNLFLRLCVLLFTGLTSLLITVANDLDLPLIRMFDRKVSPSSYLFVNTIMGLLALGVCYTVMSAGVRNMLARRPDNDSIAALGIFVSVIAGIATLFSPDSISNGFYHVYISAAIVGLIFNTLGKMMIVQRTEKNFRYIAGDFDRYAVGCVDSDMASGFGRGAVPSNVNMSCMRKTEFVEDFMKNSYSSDISDDFAKRSAPIILIVGVITGLLSFVFEKSANTSVEKIYTALAATSGTITMCSSLSLMLAVNLPINKAANKFLQFSSVILGYSAVDEYSDTNSIIVDAAQLFPKESVDLVNLKLLSTDSLEECILMAASLTYQADSVLKNSFYKILKGKLDMLYPVESYIYEDEQGLSGWIDNKRVLLGTRRHMENHSIDGLPPVSKESEYGKGNVILYLSISGVVSTMFVVRVTPSISVTKWMQALEREGIVTVVRSVDGFISERFLERLFELDQGSLKILPFRYHKEYEAETGYTEKMSSSMMCSGHFPAFAMLITGVKRIRSASQLGIAIQVGSVALGAAICIISMVMGSFSQITPSLVVAYHVIFSLITMLMLETKKI